VREIEGEREHRRGLQGILGRIARKLKPENLLLAPDGRLAIRLYDADDPNDQPDDSAWIWLPKIDPLPGETEPPE
jgi:hypothetical protein